MHSFLIDECVPRDVYEAIARAGHKLMIVRDNLLGASDEEIIALNARPPSGVVVLLMGDAAPSVKAARVVAVMPAITDTLANAVTVISPTNVRRRMF